MNKNLKIFGLIWTSIFLLIAFYPVFYNKPPIYWSLYLAFFFAISAFFYPQLYLKIYFYQGWIKFGNFVGLINSRIIIFILFYVIFMPMGLVLKLFGRDILNKKLNKTQPSYFIDRSENYSNLENQF